MEDRPPSLITTTLLSLQHLLAALGGIIAVPLVFGGALKLPADQIVALVNAALLGFSIVTIIQCRGVGPVGIRLPCVEGTSFAFVGAGISVGLEHGVPGILGLFAGGVTGDDRRQLLHAGDPPLLPAYRHQRGGDHDRPVADTRGR